MPINHPVVACSPVMRKILIVSASRAERGLLEPIMAELKAIDGVIAKWFFFDTSNSIEHVIKGFDLYLRYFNPDIVLCPCDRNEMLYPAARAFHQGYAVAQLHGGDLGGYPDDENRFAISFLSQIIFCETPQARENLLRMGFPGSRVYAVGSTAFDQVKIDESLCPKEPYELVLLHPDPASAQETWKDYQATLREIGQSDLVYWLEPNRDRNYEIIQNGLDKAIREEDPKRWKIYKPYVNVLGNLPRSQFLGLLKNCKRFIGNSSSMNYELQFINPNAQTIHIGARNRHRESVYPVTGGSRRIATILAYIPLQWRTLHLR